MGEEDLHGWARLIRAGGREGALPFILRVELGESVTFEYRVRRPDGQIRWLRNTDFPIRDDTGRIRRIGGIGQDVTEQKRAEEALRESEARHGFLLELSDALRTPSDERAIREVVVRMLGEHLRLDRCWLAEVLEREDTAIVGPDHHRPDLSPAAGSYRLSDYPAIMRELATVPLRVEDAAEDPCFADAERALLAGLHIRALLVAPLRKGPQHVVWA